MKRDRDRFRRLSLWAAVVVTVLVTASDYPSGVLTGFWRDHSMAAGIVSGLVLLGFAGAVVERLFIEREERRWRNVANTAFLEFGGHLIREHRLLVQVAGLSLREEPYGVPAQDHPRLEAVLEQYRFNGQSLQERLLVLCSDPDWADLAARAIQDRQDKCRETLSRWAPIMVSSDRLSRVLTSVTDVLDGMNDVQIPLIHLTHNAQPIGNPDAWGSRWVDLAAQSARLAVELNPFAGDLGMTEHVDVPTPQAANQPWWRRFGLQPERAAARS